MRKLTIKAIILILLLVIIRQSFDAILPVADMQTEATKKLQAISIDSDCNMVFVGSSRFLRGIIPSVIDSILLEYQTKSINLGLKSFTFPYIRDFLVETRFEKHVEYIVIELNGPRLDFENKWPWVEFVLDEVDEKPTREIRLILAEAVEKLPEMLNVRANLLALFAIGSLPPDFGQDGYMPYSEHQGNDMEQSLLSTSQLTTELYLLHELPSHIHSYDLERLIAYFEAREIRLIFLLPPLVKNELEASFVSGAFYSLGEQSRLNLYSDRYAKLLMDSTKRLNYYHFNNDGAIIYSEILGEKLNEHLSKWPDHKKRDN